MTHPYLLIVVTMVSTGLLGGWLNYLRGKKEDAENASLLHSLAGGVIASLLVPLFLNMISSDLLDKITGTTGNPEGPAKLLVFVGFCLVAAVSSKAFISTLSDRILSEAKTARKVAEQTKQEVEPIIAKETEKEPQEIAPLSLSVADQMVVGEDAKKVLQALSSGRFTLRTRSGIANDTGIEKQKVNDILEDLVGLGLVRKVKVLIRGEPKARWYISEKGRALPLQEVARA